MRAGSYGCKWCELNRLVCKPDVFRSSCWIWNRIVLLLLLLVVTARCGAAPTFDTSNPVSFFTNVASRLVKSELNLDLNRLEIYPTNQYTPAIQRLLQVTANVYDATTTNRFPTVFRPLFSSNATGTNIFITGYQQVTSVTGVADAQLAAPVDPMALAHAQTPFTNASINVYGIPWIIGAKKGLPNFNQFCMRSTVQVTRQLQVTRPSSSYIGATGTNQMFTISVTNRLGYSFWNSYNATNIASGSGLTVYARDIVSMTLSNGANGSVISSFYGNPNLVQFAFATNLSYWPGSGWTLSSSNPLFQTSQPSSFISGYWDFAFLPESSYLPASKTFAPVGTVAWETGDPVVEPFPRIWLLTTNWLQAFILDGTNVIDYVQFKGPNSARNIVEELSDSTNNLADISSINNNTAMWDTNTFLGNDILQWGPVNQIMVSRYNPSGTLRIFWKRLPEMPGALNTPELEAAYFNAFFTGNLFVYNGKIYANTNTSLQAPYQPTRSMWEYISWQANDPLVHYLASDLNTIYAYTGLHRSDDLTVNPPPNPNLGSLGLHYQPWGRNAQMLQTANTDANAYNSDSRDPLIWKADDWNFPTGESAANLSWLGRVHRGTPWQTIYLKSGDVLQETQSVSSNTFVNVGTNTWAKWCGVANENDIQSTSPVSDRRVASILASMLETNDLSKQFSVNNPDSNAWAALLDGFVVSTNTATLPISYLTPTFDNFVISSNSPQAMAIAAAIESARSTKLFFDLGDVFSVPELSQQSPYLNWNDVNQQNYGINDEAYEALTSQLLPLLRSDSFGSIISGNGQVHLQFSGYDGHDYAIQVSTDLSHWKNLTTNSPVDGTINLPVPSQSGSLSGFYRSVFLR